MKNRTLLLIMFLSVTLTGYTLPPKLSADSLARLLASATREDSNKVKLLLEYSRCFFSKNLDTALIINEQALKIAQKINFSYGEIRGFNNIAACYWYMNNPEKAISSFHEALSRATKAHNADLQAMVSNNLGIFYKTIGISDSALKYNKMAVNISKKLRNKARYAKAISDLGMVYFNSGNYVEALGCTMEAKNFYDSTHMLYDLVATYSSLGLIYYSIEDFEKSITFYRKGLQINDSVKDTNLGITILQNIGLLYYEVKQDFDSAKIFLTKALRMARENHIQGTSLSALVNLGNIAIEEKDFKLAISLYNEGFESPLIPYRNQERAAILVNLGVAYVNLGDLVKGEKYAKEGIKLAEEQKFVTYERTACKILGEIEAKKKNYKEAFQYYVRYSSLQDTLGNAEVKEKMAETVFQNTLKQKENENILLQKDNEIKRQTIYEQRFFMVAASVILLLVIILLAVINRNSRKQRTLNRILDMKNLELKELNLKKDKFFSIIAHDLKSPFNGLLGLLTDLDENYDDLDEPSKRQIIGSLKRSSHNTFNLLVNLLDWTQSQGGQIKCVPQDIFVNEIAKEVLVILSARAAAKNQVMINEIEEDTQIYSDPRIIQSMLLNLVNNAIKFTPANGTISLRSRKSADFL